MENPEKLKYFQLLNDTDVYKKREAILALSDFEDPHIFKILSSYFFESHNAIRDALFKAFTIHKKQWVAEIAADVILSSHLGARSLAIDILEELGETSIWPLRRLLKNSSPDVRKIAAEVLTRIHTPAAADVLFAHLQEKDENVLYAIIEGLGAAHDLRALPVLLNFFQHNLRLRPIALNALLQIVGHWQLHLFNSDQVNSDEFLKLTFLYAIQENGNTSALPRCMDLILNDDNENIRIEAFHALYKIISVNAILTLPENVCQVLYQFWKAHSTHLSIEQAVKILSRIPSPKCIRFFEKLLQNGVHRQLAVTALAEFGSYFPAIFFDNYSHLHPDFRVSVLQIMDSESVEIRYDRVEAVLAAAKSARERWWLLKVFSKTGDSKLIPVVEKEISRNSYTVREQFLLLRPFADSRFIPLHLKMAQSLEFQEHTDAVRKLVELDLEVVPYLIKELSNRPVAEWSYFVFLASQLSFRAQYEFWKGLISFSQVENSTFIKSYLDELKHPLMVAAVLLAASQNEQLFKEIEALITEKQIRFVWPLEAEEIRTGHAGERKNELLNLVKKFARVTRQPEADSGAASVPPPKAEKKQLPEIEGEATYETHAFR